MPRLLLCLSLLVSVNGAFQSLSPPNLPISSSARAPTTPRLERQRLTLSVALDDGEDFNSDVERPSSPVDKDPLQMKDVKELGGYDPSENIGGKEINVGDPQIRLKEKERSVTSILRELAAIQQQGPQKYCILGTRHCSYLHQQIIELLAYALVLSGNHVYTSGAGGTHAATIRGALRAERPDLLTVILPQSLNRQTKESQELLREVEDIIEMPQNDELSLDVASRLCNSKLLELTDQLISFAFHESSTVIEATKEAKKLDMIVTVLYLD